ncbi:MAG TPA: hypothetical protein VH744_12845, partial [Terriglobales bacterium]
FLQDFGAHLAPMVAMPPQSVPKGPEDTSTLRLAARVQGDHGFVFVNNYLRLYPLPERQDFQIRLKLPTETLAVPRNPTNIPAGAYFIWPVNLDLGGVILKYATAQLLTRLKEGKSDYYFFFQQPGIAPEFVFDGRSVASLEAGEASVRRDGDGIYVSGITAGPAVAVTLRSPAGKVTRIVVLTRSQAENTWQAVIRGQKHLFLSSADVFFEGARMHLRSRDANALTLSIFPNLKPSSTSFHSAGRAGIFATYTTKVHPKEIPMRWEKIRDAAPSTPVRKGKYNALAPTGTDFDQAAVWRISLPENALQGLSDVFLHIEYIADVARLYHSAAAVRVSSPAADLLSDDFYKGTAWEVGLKRFAPQAFHKLDLKLMPLRKDAPIYLPQKAWPPFPPQGELAEVRKITTIPEYEAVVEFGP